VESVVALTPDLVIATNIDSDIRVQLESMGIDVLLIPAHIIDENPAQYRLLGEVFDVADRAEVAATYIEDRWAEVETALAGVAEEEKPRIYFESAMSTGATNSFKTLGPGSGSDVLINLAAGVNIAAELGDGGNAPEVSAEWIVAENPDVIVSYAPGTMLGWQPELGTAEAYYSDIVNRPGFDQITAVQDGRVLLIPSGIMSDPLNPVGLFYLASFLHPELVSPERAAQVHAEMLEEFFDTDYSGTWIYTR
jgi:iron complex transport system substrate-binding protein